MPTEEAFTAAEIAAYCTARLPDLKQTISGEWRGPCPIHQGGRDSFAVDPETGRWFCHSKCGRGGGLISLEMELGETDFKSAKAEVLRISGRVHYAASKTLKKAFPQVADYSWTFLDQRIHEFAEEHHVKYVASYAYRYPDRRFAYVKVKFKAADGKKTFQKYAPTEKGGWTSPSTAGVPALLYNAHLLHCAESADVFSDQLRAAARQFYGAPFREFVRRLSGRSEQIVEKIRQLRSQFMERCVPEGATGEVKRAAGRFALIGIAGELATRWNLTGWDKGEALRAAERLFNEWRKRRGTTGSFDELAMIQQVRRILERDGDSRFQELSTNGDKNYPVRERIGFRRPNSSTKETEYLVLQEAFKTELCAGFDFRSVCKALHRHDYLVREDSHWTIKPGKLPGFSTAVRVYCIRAAILR